MEALGEFSGWPWRAPKNLQVIVYQCRQLWPAVEAALPIDGRQETANQEEQHLLRSALCALTTLPSSSTWNDGTPSPWKPHSLCRMKVNSIGYSEDQLWYKTRLWCQTQVKVSKSFSKDGVTDVLEEDSCDDQRNGCVVLWLMVSSLNGIYHV